MSEQKSEQRQYRNEGWLSLLQYSLLLFSVGMLTGYFMTLCNVPDGPRWARAMMYTCYGLLWLLALACFIATGCRLKEKQTKNHD